MQLLQALGGTELPCREQPSVQPALAGTRDDRAVTRELISAAISDSLECFVCSKAHERM